MRIRRKAVVFAAAAILAAGTAAVVVQGPAQAHGTPLVPGSRTWLCYRDGLTPQGNIVPKNPACAAAVAQSGDTSLYNWFGVLNSNAGGRTTGFIPDGQLCSGANPTFSGYNLARNDWPVTHLTAGRTIEIDYSNWAKHPGTFFAYVTKDSWSPTRALAWSDLEDQPFSTVTDPAQVGGPGTIDGHYFWNATLPANKSGRHIIYMRWVRSDSQENFFSCSDVVFDGGNGEVTGIGDTGSTGGPTGGTTGSPAPGNGACNVSIAITNSWPGGFQAEGTVRAAPSAINGWTVTLTNPSGQSVSQVWNGNLIGSNQVRNAAWNGSIPANGSTTFGFIGTSSGTPSAPSGTCASP